MHPNKLWLLQGLMTTLVSQAFQFMPELALRLIKRQDAQGYIHCTVFSAQKPKAKTKRPTRSLLS